MIHLNCRRVIILNRVSTKEIETQQPHVIIDRYSADSVHKHPFLVDFYFVVVVMPIWCFGSNSTRYSGGRITTTTTFSSVEKRERRCWGSVVLGSMGW